MVRWPLRFIHTKNSSKGPFHKYRILTLAQYIMLIKLKRVTKTDLIRGIDCFFQFKVKAARQAGHFLA